MMDKRQNSPNKTELTESSVLDKRLNAVDSQPVYDPQHLAAVILLSFLGIVLLFWLLWSILVFGGGIFPKISALFRIFFFGKKFADFGYVGYPYELGIFEGWIVNTAALLLGIGLLVILYRVYRTPRKRVSSV